MKPIVSSVHIAAQSYKGPAEKAPRAAAADGVQAMRAQETAVRVDISREARQAAQHGAENVRQARPRSFKELAALEAAEKMQETPRLEPAAPQPARTASAAQSPAPARGEAEMPVRPRLGRIIDMTV